MMGYYDEDENDNIAFPSSPGNTFNDSMFTFEDTHDHRDFTQLFKDFGKLSFAMDFKRPSSMDNF